MKKKHLFTALFVALATATFGQSNFGIDYFGFGEYNAAKKYFQDKISQKPTAESYYYLGEIASKEGKTDEAQNFYAKGLEVDATYMLNFVGEGKLLFKTNQKEAETKFDEALKKNKKDPAILIAIARAYYENGMKDIALQKIEIARKYNKKSPLTYEFEGDILLADQKPGDANGKYEQACYFDKSYTIAAIKSAKVYQSINPTMSLELLKKELVEHPDYKVIYGYLGKSYCLVGRYQDAITSYKTYFEEKDYTVSDITTFASAYYFSDQFDQSIALIDEGLKMEPDNFVLCRLRMYNAAKTKDAQGLTYADHFFSLPTSASSTFITLDYTCYAQLLTAAKQYDKALQQYQKVLDAGDAKNAEMYKDMSLVYSSKGDNINAALTYQKYIDLIGDENVDAMDYYQMGRSYYAAGAALAKDSTSEGKAKEMEYLMKADSIFIKVTEKAPDSYTGYLWRGHTNSLMDPNTEKGLAKPFYEAAINAILSKGTETNGNKKDLIQAYRYLGYYYYIKEDKVNSSIYWNKILELDPQNVDAKQVLDSYKTKETKK